MKVLIIAVETPSVKIARGSASILNNGLIKELASEKINPATTYNTQGAEKASIDFTVPNQEMQRNIPKLETIQRKRKTKNCCLITCSIIT